MSRRPILTILLLITAWNGTARGGEGSMPAEVKTSVAVLDLKATGLDENLVKNLGELLTSEAGKIPGFKVIGHSEILDMLGFEADKQQAGCDDVSCMAELGGALGVDLMVTGSVGKVGETFVINVKLIDIGNSETRYRVGETIAGRVELLPPFMRIVAWQLFQQPVPADVTASYEATKARLDANAAQAAEDARAQTEADKARAEADRLTAEAEKAKAEVERLKVEKSGSPEEAEALAEAKRLRAEAAAAKAEAEKLRQESAERQAAAEKRRAAGGGSHVATASNQAPRKRKTSSGHWSSTGKSMSSVVASVGLLGGGVLHAWSFLKMREVGDGNPSVGGDGLTIYDVGSQESADDAKSFRQYAIYGYAVGVVGLIGFAVFKIIEPAEPDATAVRVVPTGDGFAVVF